MLDQLVESKSNAGDNTRRSGFLVTVFVIMSAILVSGIVYSLFAKDYGMGDGGLELSTLVAPVPVEDEPPPKPEVQPADKKAPNVDTRTDLIQNMSESPKIPDKTSTEKPTVPPRDPNKYTAISDRNSSAENAPPPSYGGPINTQGTGSNEGGTGTGPAGPPGGGVPPPPPPAEKPPPPVPKQISGGVLNGKATSLPKPAYPPAARAVRAAGAVTVQVLIDENGNVVSASAVSGHQLLKAAAVSAARSAKFSPTKLSGQAVKVSGVITYNFVP